MNAIARSTLVTAVCILAPFAALADTTTTGSSTVLPSADIYASGNQTSDITTSGGTLPGSITVTGSTYLTFTVTGTITINGGGNYNNADGVGAAPSTSSETGAKNDFERAIAQDAGFAPAYAGLAETYDLLREYSTLPSEQAYPKAKQAAERAIALDPNLADAHAALGYEEFFWEWDRTRAEAEFRRAIALDPNSGASASQKAGCPIHDDSFIVVMSGVERGWTPGTKPAHLTNRPLSQGAYIRAWPDKSFVSKTLKTKVFRIKTLQLKSKPKSIPLKTLRKNRGEGDTVCK